MWTTSAHRFCSSSRLQAVDAVCCSLPMHGNIVPRCLSSKSGFAVSILYSKDESPPRLALRSQLRCQLPSTPRQFNMECLEYSGTQKNFALWPKRLNLIQNLKGLSEEFVQLISAKNKEPEWMLHFRLESYRQWLKMEEPKMACNKCPPIDFERLCKYNIVNKQVDDNDVIPDLKAGSRGLHPFVEKVSKMELPSEERSHFADIDMEDSKYGSASFPATHKEALTAAGVIFCSISEAIHKYPELVKKYLGKVVPAADNYYAALNSAVFMDGFFCYVPKNTICPMDIATQFLTNGKVTSQFERNLIVCDNKSYVSSLGCTSPAPNMDAQQWHADVVELYCGEEAEIKHSTVQNWHHAGEEKDAKPEVYNFVTQRGLCEGTRSKITWLTVEAGSTITWQHPSVVLKGDDSVGNYFSVCLTNSAQEANTGADMIHIGKNTRSRIIAKSISAGTSANCYQGLVQVEPSAQNAKNQTQCDAILIGNDAQCSTHPSVLVKNASARVEQKGSTSRISKDQIFYFQQRGIVSKKAATAIMAGFCSEVLQELPNEFEAEVMEMVSSKIKEALTSSGFPLTA